MNYPKKYIKHAINLMAYLEKNKFARSAELVELGIDRSYLSQLTKMLVTDGYIRKNRIDGGYTYYFVKPFSLGSNEKIPRHEMQELFNKFVKGALRGKV